MASTKEIQEYILNLIQSEHECGNVDIALAKLIETYPDKYITSLVKLSEFILPKGIDLTEIGDGSKEVNVVLSDEQYARLIDSL